MDRQRTFPVGARYGCGLILAGVFACSNGATVPNSPGAAGSGGSQLTGGAASGGTSSAMAGSSQGGAGGNSGTGGVGGGAGSSLAGMGGGANGGSGGSSPACKAVTALNGSGLTVNAPDISAFSYAPSPAANVVKMAYDPVGKAVVFLTKDGQLFSVDPRVPLPTTASTAAVTATQAYASGYSANAGYADHRGLAFGPDGTLYVLAVQVNENSGVNIKKGVPGAAGGARVWTTLVTTSQGFSASGTAYDHSFSGIAVSLDGASLFFSSGSRTEHGESELGARELPLTSAIFKVPTASATDLKNDQAALAPLMFADGTRNTYDLAFNAAGDLIGTENGPDIDLPDEVNFLEAGKHYGFPWRFGNVDNPVRDAAYVPSGDKRLHAGYGAVDNGSYAYDATFPAPPVGVAFVDPILNLGPDANYLRVDRNAEPSQAGPTGLAGVSGHRSPLGISFDTAGALCGDYFQQGFMLSNGAVLLSALGDPGKDLLLLSLTKTAGSYRMTAKQLAMGISGPIDSVLVDNRLFTAGYGGDASVYVFVLPTP